MTTGEFIRMVRERKRISVSDLAAAVGVSTNAITAIERGERGSRLSTAIKIADALDVPLDAMCGRIKYKPPAHTDADYERLNRQYENAQRDYANLLKGIKELAGYTTPYAKTVSYAIGTEGFKKVCSRPGEHNAMSVMTEGDVIDIRSRKKIGEPKAKIRADYPQISKSGFDKIWFGTTWKNIAV